MSGEPLKDSLGYIFPSLHCWVRAWPLDPASPGLNPGCPSLGKPYPVSGAQFAHLQEGTLECSLGHLQRRHVQMPQKE